MENDEQQENIENENDESQEEGGSFEEDEEEPENIGESIIKYNPLDFQMEKIILILKELQLLKKENICPKCNNSMHLTNNKNFKDKICWRRTKKGNNSHDIKINIRNGSIFSLMKCDLRILYFIIFNNFTKNNSVNATFRNCKEFCKDLKLETISRKYIGKIFNIIRHKIMENTHSYWNNNYMGMVPGVDGKSRIEIDESKLITFDNNIRWMFGLVDRNKYDIRLFFVNNNRVKETLLPIIIKNVYTYQNILNNNEGKNAEYLATRIYSDCLQTYQKEDFNQKGYILYKVNHSVWFSTGKKFHINTIEGV